MLARLLQVFVVQTNIDSLEDLNLITTLTENPSFTGNKTDVVKVDNYITLDTTTLFDSLSGDFDDQIGTFDIGGEFGGNSKFWYI